MTAIRARRLAPVLLLLVLLMTGVVAGVAGSTLPARAEPAAGTDPTTTEVRVSVDRLDPQIVRADSTIEVSGRLTNTTDHPMTAPGLRLQAGAPLHDRGQLDTGRIPAAESAFCSDFTALGRDLPPKQAVPFRVQCSAHQLGLSTAGVYPILVNLNATQFDGSTARVGQALTTVPFLPQRAAAPTKVAWLWPIADRPHRFTPGLLYDSGHRLPSGVFRDDDLAARLATGGRLGQLVDTALRAPAAVALTVAVDPELVSEVEAMQRPYRVAHGQSTVAGTGQAVAKAWLSRLRQLVHRTGVTLAPLPYGDPDLVALADAGLTDQIGSAYQQGESVLRETLGGDLPTPLELAWPADGQLDDQTLYALAGRSMGGVVVGDATLPAQDSRTATADASAGIPAAGGTLPAAVTDQQLDDVVSGSRLGQDGERLLRQRFDAELAMITLEAPSTARTVVVAPPRNWSVSPTFLRDLLADTARLPWAASGSVSAVLTARPTVHRGALTFPADARRALLPAAQTDAVKQLAGTLNGFRAMLSNSDADKVLTPYYRALLTCSSLAWRNNHQLGASFLTDLRSARTGLTSQVYIVPPSTKQRSYTLASSSSPMVLTVANSLGVPVTVQVQVSSRGSAGFHAKPVTLTVRPGDRLTVKVPAHVERSGVFSVTAGVRSARGHQALGAPVELRVRSTAYGAITLGITGGAFGLLLLLVARRLVRRIRAGREQSQTDPATEYPTGEYPRPIMTGERPS